VNPHAEVAPLRYGLELSECSCNAYRVGAPIRLVVPWKYGNKSIKSMVEIVFVAEHRRTFWETLAPDEYPFRSNMNPKRPHPHWTQATSG